MEIKPELLMQIANEQILKWGIINLRNQASKTGILIAVELDQKWNYRIIQEADDVWSRTISFNKTVGKIIEEFGGEVSSWMTNGVVGFFDPRDSSGINSIYAAIQIQLIFSQLSLDIPEKVNQYFPKIVISYGKVFKNIYGSFPIGEAMDIAVNFLRYTKPRQIIVHSKLKERIDENTIEEKTGLKKVFGKRETRGIEGVDVDVHELFWNSEKLDVSELPDLSFRNIISKFDINTIEGNARSEVWICAPTIEFDMGLLEGVVEHNLQRGIKYRYMIPNGDASVRFKALRRQWERKGIDHQNLVQCRLYDEGCILTTIAVYDPYENESTALVMLPSNDTLKVQEYPFVFCINDRSGVEFYARRLESLWNRKGCFRVFNESE